MSGRIERDRKTIRIGGHAYDADSLLDPHAALAALRRLSPPATREECLALIGGMPWPKAIAQFVRSELYESSGPDPGALAAYRRIKADPWDPENPARIFAFFERHVPGLLGLPAAEDGTPRCGRCGSGLSADDVAYLGDRCDACEREASRHLSEA